MWNIRDLVIVQALLETLFICSEGLIKHLKMTCMCMILRNRISKQFKLKARFLVLDNIMETLSSNKMSIYLVEAVFQNKPFFIHLTQIHLNGELFPILAIWNQKAGYL